MSHNHLGAGAIRRGQHSVGGVIRDVWGLALPTPHRCVCLGHGGARGSAVARRAEPRRVAGRSSPACDSATARHPTVTARCCTITATRNPMVFCGTAACAAREAPHNLRPATRCVVGGRTGRVGSTARPSRSAELTHTNGIDGGSAVQIGDTITEKRCSRGSQHATRSLHAITIAAPEDFSAVARWSRRGRGWR